MITDFKKWDDSTTDVYIFGDESGYENGGFLAFGILAIEGKDLEIVFRMIEQIAIKNNHVKEISYKNLSNNLMGSDVRTAVEWLNILRSSLPIYFNYQETELNKDNFDSTKYVAKHHIYNVFYKLAIKTLLHRRYSGKKINVHLVLHRRSTPVEEKNDYYNKEEYFTKKAVPSCGKIILNNVTYTEMGTDHNFEENKMFSRLLQLTDLFTGATRNAIYHNSNLKGKFFVSQLAAKTLYESNANTFQSRFTFFRFPGEDNSFSRIRQTKIYPASFDAPGKNMSLKAFT